MSSPSSIACSDLTHFAALSLKIFLYKFLIFFPKKTHSEKISYIFSKKEAFLMFWGTELSYIFLKKFFLYFGKWSFLALSIKHFGRIFSEPNKNLKNFLMFWEMELSRLNLKKNSDIPGGNFVIIFFQKINSSYLSYCFQK